MVCNDTAACPVDNTCCRLASSNWGCCPGPNAVCCPGGATCCPQASKCVEKTPGADPRYRCGSDLEDTGASSNSNATQPRPPWPPVVPPSPSSSSAGTPARRRPVALTRSYRKPAAAAGHTVSSADGATAVTIDATTGDITSIARQNGHTFDLQGFTTMNTAPSTAWKVDVGAVYPAVRL